MIWQNPHTQLHGSFGSELEEMPASACWSEHTAPSGQKYYYDRLTGTSQWQRPAMFRQVPPHRRITLQRCAEEEPVVSKLLNTILAHCGASAVPSVGTRSADDPFCAGGRGGAFCCVSKQIFLCEKPWVGCREVAYELSHALNVCRGQVRCSSGGVEVDGSDCGYVRPALEPQLWLRGTRNPGPLPAVSMVAQFAPPDVACSELRAAKWTGRCAPHSTDTERQRCLEWHARWAVASCFPEDEHLEAHVRHARTKCAPSKLDLVGGLGEYLDQYVRFDL